MIGEAPSPAAATDAIERFAADAVAVLGGSRALEGDVRRARVRYHRRAPRPNWRGAVHRIAG